MERRSWAVARTRAHREALASSALEEQGFEVFCPMTRRTVRRARRLLDRRIPLFPGYVFVTVEDASQAWRPINSTRGVRALLTDVEGRPSILPPGFVEDMLARMGADGTVMPVADLTPGQRVRVRSGAFADLVGEVTQLDLDGRVRVLLSLMSRAVRVSLPSGTVEGGACAP